MIFVLGLIKYFYMVLQNDLHKRFKFVNYFVCTFLNLFRYPYVKQLKYHIMLYV